MSVIGRIGQFIIDYQAPIEAALLIMLALILVILLVRLIVKNAKSKHAEEDDRNKLLEELIKV